MRFVLTIDLDNACFDSPFEGSHGRDAVELGTQVEHVGHAICDRAAVLQVGDAGILRDVNGNTVGNWRVEEE